MDLISAEEHRKFYAALHRRDYVKREPLDEVLPIRRPQKLKSMFDFIIKNNVFKLETMLDEVLHVDVKFLHRLTGVDLQFFESYWMGRKQTGNKHANVVQLHQRVNDI